MVCVNKSIYHPSLQQSCSSRIHKWRCASYLQKRGPPNLHPAFSRKPQRPKCLNKRVQLWNFYSHGNCERTECFEVYKHNYKHFNDKKYTEIIKKANVSLESIFACCLQSSLSRTLQFTLPSCLDPILLLATSASPVHSSYTLSVYEDKRQPESWNVLTS